MRRAERRKYRLPSWVIRPCPDGSLTHKKRTEHPNPPASGKEEDIAGEVTHRKDFPSRRGIQSAARCLTLTLVFFAILPCRESCEEEERGKHR